MSVSADIVNAFAPTGKLRATINLGNPILANRNPASGQPYGVSLDLARELAHRLGVEVELLVLDAAGKAVEAVTGQQADVGFFAIDPKRGEGIRFTAPYVVIEGAYLVREQSTLHLMDEVDHAGNRVMVGNGSAYDLFLSRSLKEAEIVRSPTSPAVVDEFLRQGVDVAAGVRQQLEADAQRLGGLRLLPGHFMLIQQAMGLPAGRDNAAGVYLDGFVEEMKRSGFVAAALKRHGIEGAEVAPAA